MATDFFKFQRIAGVTEDGMIVGPRYTIRVRFLPSICLWHVGRSWSLHVIRYWHGRRWELEISLNGSSWGGQRLAKRVHIWRGCYPT